MDKLNLVPAIIREIVRKAVIIYQTVQDNFRKKLSFLVWYSKKEKIKNWFYLYLYFSSLLIDLLVVACNRQKWIKKLKIKARYANDVSLYFPMTTSRYHLLLSDLMSERYMNDFEKYYSRRVDFRKEDVIIDIGAHVGKFCIPIFIEHPYVRVFAFEPDPHNFDCLRRNLNVNGIEQSRFKIEPFAVYDRPGKLSFSTGWSSTVGTITGIGFFLEKEKAQCVVVEAITLDDVFRRNQIEKCRLLKIDCEGSEYAILESASDVTLSKVENLFMEVHPVKGREPALLKEHLMDRGFDVHGHLRSDGGWELFCVQQSRIAISV